MTAASEKNDYKWNLPDWDREKPRRFWDPGRKLLKTIRDYQEVGQTRNPLKLMKKNWHVLEYRFWSVITGADIPLNSNIAGGFLIPHPNGIVIYPGAIIGPNCLIFQQVTLAAGVRLGYHVDIGAGAKILGPLVIGNDVRIGANAVVTKDVPSGATVAGVPAKQIRLSDKSL
ncbi:serine acetyltransferase [bacterium]|nr:serine acetyltransferase [bacterium]